jgi:hypothetical protein
MPFYKKKPVVIDANRWDGSEESATKIITWVKAHKGNAFFIPVFKSYGWDTPARLVISTLEGDMDAKPGDYIIKGIKDEFYPCDEEIFVGTYEPLSHMGFES